MPRMQSDILALYPSSDKVNSYDSGDSRADRILNTAATASSRTISTIATSGWGAPTTS